MLRYSLYIVISWCFVYKHCTLGMLLACSIYKLLACRCIRNVIGVNILRFLFDLQFCATRKGTQQAANILIKDARFVMNSQHKQKLVAVANSLKDSKLRGKWTIKHCVHQVILVSNSSHPIKTARVWINKRIVIPEN